MPVIPVNREAEAGKSLEPGRRRLSGAEIAPLHSSRGDKSKTPSQKKKEKSNKIGLVTSSKGVTLNKIKFTKCFEPLFL